MILHTATIKWENYAKLVKEPDNYLKAIELDITTFMFNQKPSPIMFYLNNKKELKYVEYKLKENDPGFNNSQSVHINKIKTESFNQVEISKKTHDMLNTNQVTDVRDDILIPIIFQYFKIKNPTMVHDKIIWEDSISNKDLEITKIYNDESLSIDEKLEALQEMLEKDFPENDINTIN